MTSSVASKVVFLSDLSALPAGDKVRFLGCVESYNTTTGILTLKHDYLSANWMAHVNIEHVREALPRSATDVGCWVNVVGYVTKTTTGCSHVQATMLWDVGPLNIADYERALQARKDAGS